MNFPDAIDPDMVGEYPALAKSGAGYFFDQVLEYRVWCHPEPGAPDKYEGEDYYYAFVSYVEALEFSKSTDGTEEPLVLIRQLEWINEPEEGVFIHEVGERVAEWCVEWLSRGSRKTGDIEAFIETRGRNKI
jgi:hypothetical protein